MEEGLLDFTRIRLNKDIMDEVWDMNPSQIDTIDGAVISAYAIALSQYLIYFTYKRNKLRAKVIELNNYIDRTVSLIIASYQGDAIKKLKTKSAITDYFVSKNESLSDAQNDIDGYNKELMYIEGIDKHISELIASLKRELTRRENELYHIRSEYK